MTLSLIEAQKRKVHQWIWRKFQTDSSISAGDIIKYVYSRMYQKSQKNSIFIFSHITPKMSNLDIWCSQPFWKKSSKPLILY